MYRLFCLRWSTLEVCATGSLKRKERDGYRIKAWSDVQFSLHQKRTYLVWSRQMKNFVPGRGESPKAFVVLKHGFVDRVTEEDLLKWCKENMAAYKRQSNRL